MTKEEESKLLQRGAEIASEIYKPLIKELNQKISDLQLEISLNKNRSNWRSVYTLDIDDALSKTTTRVL